MGLVDEIDSFIVECLSNYVDIKNIALKNEREAGKFILGGKLKATPAKTSGYEEALSLGMTAMNEIAGEPLANPIPDTPLNREIHTRLVDHFKGRSNHGLRSALGGMGLVSKEKQQFTVGDRVSDAALLDRVAHRAADRCMEMMSGRQATAGYPITSIPIVGGHQIGRATSIRNETPEQIMYDGNMEVEGSLEGQSRHEYRGRKAADKTSKKLFEYLASDAVNSKEAIKVLDTMATISRLRPRR